MDVGSLLETGVPYMVLEHLVGHTLADIINARGPMSIEEAVAHTLEACEAMSEAHAAGIVHRDLKPENLFLATRPDGSKLIKVIDFGISKMTDPLELGPRSSTLTGAASIVGSPLYMSPEQLCAARDADARSDIWSLGVTLFELLTGQGPFVWRSVPELCAAVLKEPARPLRELLPHAPSGLEAVVMRCLEKDPSKRPANMAELASALRRSVIHAGVRSSGRRPRPARLLPASPTSREADITPLQVADIMPLHVTEVESPARLSESIQLSGMTTGTLVPELPAFWSLPRMAVAVFLSALLISMATARSLRVPHRPLAAGPPPVAVPLTPPPVTLEPEPSAPSLPSPAPEPPEPAANIVAPPRKPLPRPARARGSPPRSSQVDNAFGHRK
jgi:serine/threonine-protein kinase